MKDKREDHAGKLLSKLKNPLELNRLRFFSHKKNLCDDQMDNSQINHWLALSQQNIPIVIKTKYPVHIMVFGVVTSNGDVMLSFIFLHGFILKMAAYTKCLEEVMLLWIKKVAAGRPYVGQLDSAPCHTSRIIQSGL